MVCLQGAPFLSSSRSKIQRGTYRPRACSPPKREVGEVHHEPTTTDTSSIRPAPIKLERKSWPGGFRRLNDLGTRRLGKEQETYRNMIHTTTQLAVRPTAVSQDLLTWVTSYPTHITKVHNLLSKSKFQNCLLVGRPFLHHACRYTSMA